MLSLSAFSRVPLGWEKAFLIMSHAVRASQSDDHLSQKKNKFSHPQDWIFFRISTSQKPLCYGKL